MVFAGARVDGAGGTPAFPGVGGAGGMRVFQHRSVDGHRIANATTAPRASIPGDNRPANNITAPRRLVRLERTVHRLPPTPRQRETQAPRRACPV